MDPSQYQSSTTDLATLNASVDCLVSIEAEIPEILYKGMKELVRANPKWDQCKVMSSALVNFLFQNGCDDRAVKEKYLNDLFNRSEP